MALKTALIPNEVTALAVYTKEYKPRTPQPDWAEVLQRFIGRLRSRKHARTAVTLAPGT